MSASGRNFLPGHELGSGDRLERWHGGIGRILRADFGLSFSKSFLKIEVSVLLRVLALGALRRSLGGARQLLLQKSASRLRCVSARENAVVDQGPMERLEEVKRDVNAPSVVFQRLTDRETLGQIAKSWGCPKGRFVEWFTTEHADLYDAALKVQAADLALETLEIADAPPRQAVNAAGAPLFDEAGKAVLVEPDVARDKLRTAVRQWHAARYDRARFGERADVKVEVEDKRLPVDRDELIRETGRRLAYMLHVAAMQAAARPPLQLSAPIDVTPRSAAAAAAEAQPQKEEKHADAGII